LVLRVAAAAAAAAAGGNFLPSSPRISFPTLCRITLRHGLIELKDEN